MYDKDAIRKRLHSLHHVLDHQDRYPAAGDSSDQLDHLGALSGIEPADRLVQEEELRAHGERRREHQSLAGQHRLAVEGNSSLKRTSESKPRDLMRAQSLDLAVFELDGSAGGVVDSRDAIE